MQSHFIEGSFMAKQHINVRPKRYSSDQRIEPLYTRSNQNVPYFVFLKRVVYYIGGFIIAVLALRFSLLVLGASRASGFVKFIYDVSGFFVEPFNGIFTRPTYGKSTFDSATLVAIIVYAFVTIGIARLLTITKRNQDTV